MTFTSLPNRPQFVSANLDFWVRNVSNYIGLDGNKVWGRTARVRSLKPTAQCSALRRAVLDRKIEKPNRAGKSGKMPELKRWAFSTNAVTSASTLSASASMARVSASRLIL